MKIGALSLFTRTSGSGINIAAWHSPHSLTWRWLLGAGFQRIEFAKPRGMWKNDGYFITRAGSIGSLLSGYAMRHNGGWQFGLTVLGLALSFSQQRPMWFRDLYRDDQNRRYERRVAA